MIEQTQVVQETNIKKEENTKPIVNENLKELLTSNVNAYKRTLKDVEKLLPFKNYQASHQAILLYIFQTPQRATEFVKMCESIPTGVCAAPAMHHDQVYHCLDCGLKNHLFCSDCFQATFIQGIHNGHRFKANTGYGGGFCDCGDTSYIKKQSFCSDHSGQAKFDHKLDSSIAQRLQQVVLKCFEVLFHFCDQLTTYIRVLPGCDFEESMIEKPFLQFFAANIINTLAAFIVDFCKNKLPFQYAISELLMKPFNKKLQHSCNSQKFQQTFQKRQEHICSETIIDLILKYSVSLSSSHSEITRIFQSLIVNPKFKQKIAEVSLNNLNFSFITLSLNKAPTIIMTSHYGMTLNLLTHKQLNHPSMQIVKDKISFLLGLVNTKNYKQSNHGIVLSSIFLSMIRQHSPQAQIQEQSLLVLNQYLELAPITKQKGGYSLDHHRVKIVTIGRLLNLFQDFVTKIQYENQQSKQKIGELINKFFFRDIIKDEVNKMMNPQNQEQEELEDQEGEIISEKPILKQKENQQQQKQQSIDPYKYYFGWYYLQELEVGILMSSVYHYLGADQLHQMIDQMTKSKLIDILILNLMGNQTTAYQVSQSKQVGFPNEYLPKDMYRIFYKNPNIYTQDCVISLLQLFAIVLPDQFMYNILTFDIDLVLRLLCDVLMQESSFVNFSKSCGFKSEIANNALKLQIINILNLKTKITFQDMKKLYLEKMFSDEIQFDQVLFEVAQYDSKTQCYSIKDQYKDIQEVVFLKRTDESYGDFFQQQDSYLKMMKKSNLLQKQCNLGWDTTCQRAVFSLSKTQQYLPLIEKIIQQIWNSKPSSQSYQLATLIQTLLLKVQDKEYLKNIQKFLNHKAETLPQKLLVEVVRKVSFKPEQKQQKKQNPIISKGNQRMKLHLQKMKKKQALFIQNNSQLIKQVQEQLQHIKAESEAICLICHEGKIGHQFPSFLITSQSQNIEGLTLITYNSCGHYFHAKCVQQYDERICPVCKVLYDDMFPILPQSQIHMFNPNEQNEITCNIPLNTLNFFKGNPGAQTVVQISFSKIYFSILDSCSKFVNKDLNELRSMYAKYVIQKQGIDQKFITQEKLIHILYSRTEYFMDHKQSSDVLFNMIYRLLLVPFFKGSIDTKDIFTFTVSTQYTCLLADYFFGFLDLDNDDIEGQLKQHQQALYAKMGEFTKAAIFTYSLLFDDERNQVLKKIGDQDNVAQILIKTYSQIFTIQNDFFKQYVEKYKGKKQEQIEIPYSLVPVPYTMNVPQNYRQFHKLYYDLLCDQCNGIVKLFKNELWMCLLCGYRSCQQRCKKQPGLLPTASSYAHFQQYHDNSGIAIEMNSGLIGIFQSSVIFQYGYIYKTVVGKHSTQNWQQLKLQSNKWNKLLDILRRRTLLMYAVQANLKVRIFNKQQQ